MFDQQSADILASLIKGFPTTTTKQNVDPAVYYVYSRVKTESKAPGQKAPSQKASHAKCTQSKDPGQKASM
jgi:hypothetical protein